LKGLGAAIALPWLEAMGPATARAADPAARGPLRMAFLYVPNGVHMADWTPKDEGAGFTLPPILAPLGPFRQDLLVLTGLAQDKARAHGDGAGDHARALATFLTGVQARKTNGSDIKIGVSVDQVAARKVGHLTRLPSLELGIERGAEAGNCDSGYSCAYSSNISWRSESMPMAKETNPRLVFERLFTAGGSASVEADRAKRKLYRTSILDLVGDDARRLGVRLGANDRRKVDEYLTGVRELEQRIAASERHHEVVAPDYPRPEGIPDDNREHIRLMFDLMALAFQSDVTRVATFMYGNEGSNRSHKFLGAPESHHDLSHHGGDPEKHAKIRKINVYHIEQFAYFLGKLKTAREGDGSVLDNTMLVYGSGISDGNKHNHEDLPILLAGKGGGTLRPGRHIRHAAETPLNNLYLALLDRMGVSTASLGDSNGRLNSLEG
jgi:hypothetical protein